MKRLAACAAFALLCSCSSAPRKDVHADFLKQQLEESQRQLVAEHAKWDAIKKEWAEHDKKWKEDHPNGIAGAGSYVPEYFPVHSVQADTLRDLDSSWQQHQQTSALQSI